MTNRIKRYQNRYVSKKSLSVLVFSLLSLVFGCFLIFSPSASARHRSQVLGETTVSSDLSIPPTTEGPGIFLPDSPLFFLDELKQNIRLLLAFSPQTRAKVHTAIAGERLAELQFMLAKNNEERIKFALSEVSDNLKKAANDLTQARLKGKDVKLLAKTINELIKDKRKKLSFLEEQAQGELKAQVKAAKEALKAAKIEVEDNLPEDELENEIEDDLEDELEDHVRVASDSARGLEHAIDVLERLASQAGERQETRREEALRHAIEVKNEALIKQQEKALELEHKKQERLLKAKEKFIEKTREALRKAHEAAREFQKDQDEINENDGASENSGSSSSSDSKENSGSGSSGSGRSGSSGSDDDK